MTDGTRIYEEDGLWIHEAADGFIVDRKINERSSLLGFDQYTEDTWEYLYSPRLGDVVIDVGAGIGSEVHRWSRAVGPTGLVVAIEAQPETFACLKRFCELNQLENVVVLNLAIMDKRGVATIDDAAQHISSTILRESGNTEVEGASLDELVKKLELERIDFLKMNIEGAERLAIEGMTGALSRLRCLCISCHDFKAEAGEGEFYRTGSLVGAFLKRSGFTVISRESDEHPWIRDQANAVPRRFAPAAHMHVAARAYRQTGMRVFRRGSVRIRKDVGAFLTSSTRVRQRVVHVLKYSKHGYTRFVALKILVVRVLRFLRLRPPPPSS